MLQFITNVILAMIILVINIILVAAVMIVGLWILINLFIPAPEQPKIFGLY